MEEKSKRKLEIDKDQSSLQEELTALRSQHDEQSKQVLIWDKFLQSQLRLGKLGMGGPELTHFNPYSRWCRDHQKISSNWVFQVAFLVPKCLLLESPSKMLS